MYLLIRPSTRPMVHSASNYDMYVLYIHMYIDIYFISVQIHGTFIRGKLILF